VHGQQWFGRRRADRRSKFDECVAAMRRRRPIQKSKRKNPRRMLSARVNQTRLDVVIMPVCCPTCQSQIERACVEQASVEKACVKQAVLNEKARCRLLRAG